ncbi:CoA-transferase family III [Parafrankia irregularis]|uniref:CoA-transferase family III n=1 Tax=Parafrankia irregularis TaxID=795642 RepID=A0A0S4QX49_9ACTN|nr:MULTISPECIES: CoA transferase [Parafrankia]MBE3203430.1 CoA transferase [Parafrankia sp. CH37]CUU60209.1 CoA-transferase family III [Parafrankia irregularis]
MADNAMIAAQVATLVRDQGVVDRLTITGPVDVLPSLHRVTELATASVAAAAVGAGRLLVARNSGTSGLCGSGGADSSIGFGDSAGSAACWPGAGADATSQPEIEIDTRHACAAFRSERYLRVDGRPMPTPWDPISGYYRTADDRWIELHCNFPHHRAGILELLDVSNDRAEVERAVARFEAESLELELQAMGMCATMARDEDEWSSHRQAKALAELPVLEIEPLGEAAPTRLRPADLPAEGIRVLDLSRVVAGPVCGRTLAGYGAEVLRVGAAHLPEERSLLIDTGFGKRNTFLNLRVAADARRLRELISTVDVVIQAYRPRALDRLGFGPDALARLRPGVVVATISAYGRTGPWSGLRGFDSLVQTASGIAMAEGRAGGDDGPRLLPAQVLDHTAGYLAAYGVLAALARRGEEGGSWHVRTSLAQAGRWLQELGHRDTLAVPDQTRADAEGFCRRLRSEFGEVSYIAPPGTVGGRAPGWTMAPASLGTSPPGWEPRDEA